MAEALPFDPRSGAKAPFVTFEEATQFLEKTCPIFRVKHLSYWSLNIVDGLPDQVTWIATYDPNYMSHYMGRFTPLGDPAFDFGGAKTKIVDWDDLNASEEQALDIQNAAERFGIPRHGFSYLFKDGASRTIMFSVNVECGRDKWPDEKARVTDAVCGLAHYFHHRVCQLVASRRTAA